MISTTTFFEAWTMSSVTLLVLVTICQNRSMTSSHRLPELMHMLMGVNFVPLWIYAICSIFLDFHGSHFYFWLSFIPAILILVIGTKLHRVVVKLAVEIMDRCPYMKHTQFNLRDELFWFGKPRLLLWLIQLKSFLGHLPDLVQFHNVSSMGSRFKKSVISENVRKSLSKWQRRVKGRQSPSASLLGATPTTVGKEAPRE